MQKDEQNEKEDDRDVYRRIARELFDIEKEENE
jgi:hypothetical protein